MGLILNLQGCYELSLKLRSTIQKKKKEKKKYHTMLGCYHCGWHHIPALLWEPWTVTFVNAAVVAQGLPETKWDPDPWTTGTILLSKIIVAIIKTEKSTVFRVPQ